MRAKESGGRSGAGKRRTLLSRRPPDGELVAFNDAGAPNWPLVVERVLHGSMAIPVTFVAFDLLRVDGHDLTGNPWTERRELMEEVWIERGCARLADVYEDGNALFNAVVNFGFEGIVAKRRNGIYRPGYRGWTKIKNPSYWRQGSELQLMRRRFEGVGAR